MCIRDSPVCRARFVASMHELMVGPLGDDSALVEKHDAIGAVKHLSLIHI